MKTWRIIFTCLSVILILSSARIYAQNTRISWYSFNMGYTEPKAGNTMVKSVVGQSFVGTTQLSNTQVISGFLADTLFSGMIVDIKNQEQLPFSYSLWQNYPNPFNPSTTIHFEIPEESRVTLKVYNMLGQELMTVLDENRAAGRYDVRIDGSAISSGVYFYRLTAGEFTSTKKLLLIR